MEELLGDEKTAYDVTQSGKNMGPYVTGPFFMHLVSLGRSKVTWSSALTADLFTCRKANRTILKSSGL